MHTSKLSTFVIDCKTEDLPSAARFWSAALRRELADPQPGDERYRDLVTAPAEPIIMIQRVPVSKAPRTVRFATLQSNQLRSERAHPA